MGLRIEEEDVGIRQASGERQLALPDLTGFGARADGDGEDGLAPWLAPRVDHDQPLYVSQLRRKIEADPKRPRYTW